MEEPLAAWEAFYVIVGSSAAALTGLQFVVIVLAAEMGALGRGAGVSAFATPTIVHFCSVLFTAAVISAPWHSFGVVSLLLIAGGLAGVLYAVIVVRNARRQTDYKPVLEDWVWHGTLPLVAYTVMALAAFTLRERPESSLFWIGGAAVLLLFIGIHNAWDSVVYIAHRRRETEAENMS